MHSKVLETQLGFFLYLEEWAEEQHQCRDLPKDGHSPAIHGPRGPCSDLTSMAPFPISRCNTDFFLGGGLTCGQKLIWFRASNLELS